MSLSEPFMQLDPLSGTVPGYPFQSLPDIATKAREMLTSRTAEQINSAVYALDWAIFEYFFTLKETEICRLQDDYYSGKISLDYDTFFRYEEGHGDGGEWIFNESMEERLKIPTAANTDDIDALKKCIDSWEDIGGDDFPDGKAYEFFAVMALNYLAMAIKSTKQTEYVISETINAKGESKVVTGQRPPDLAFAGNYALSAMKAICYAEHLVDMARISTDQKNEEKKRRSMKSQKLSIARHRLTREAKEKVTMEWEKNRSRFPSADQAGNHLSTWLAAQNIQYEPRTVSGWIRAYADQIGVKFR